MLTETWGPGREGVPVLSMLVDGLGHHWPGSRSSLPEALVGKPPMRLDATTAIWRFFSSVPLRR